MDDMIVFLRSILFDLIAKKKFTRKTNTHQEMSDKNRKNIWKKTHLIRDHHHHHFLGSLTFGACDRNMLFFFHVFVEWKFFFFALLCRKKDFECHQTKYIDFRSSSITMSIIQCQSICVMYQSIDRSIDLINQIIIIQINFPIVFFGCYSKKKSLWFFIISSLTFDETG